MSLSIIRAALEKKLVAQIPTIATAFENAVFQTTTGVPYQRVNLIPARPDNSIAGGGTYFERGFFQVTLCYQLGTGPAAAETQAQLLRAYFKRGITLVEQGITVVVVDTPKVATGFIDVDRFCIPVSIPFQAQIST